MFKFFAHEFFCNSFYFWFQVTIDDHLEMFLQFGYIYLFSSVYPLAAFWAFANNICEIRTDAFKMCNVFMRPFPRSASSIGAWQVSIDFKQIRSKVEQKYKNYFCKYFARFFYTVCICSKHTNNDGYSCQLYVRLFFSVL